MSINLKKKGSIFVITLVISLILMIIGMGISNLVTQDLYFVKKVEETAKSRFISEAGINDAVARLAENFDLTIFPISNTITGGSYTVVYTISGVRVMLKSTGTSDQGTASTTDDISTIVAVEIDGAAASALNYIMSAGNNVKIRSIKDSIDINGKLHGNNRAHIQTAVGTIDISETVTYSEDTVELDVGGGSLKINGVTYGNGTHQDMDAWQSPLVTFPEFDYGYF